VLIIPGSRGKGALYSDVKKLLLTKYPIPSQVILSGTLAKDKGYRSVVNKVFIQISAKIGGEPWAIDGLPFTQKPTMICGIDVFSGSGKKSILGFTSTYNRTFTKYTSIAKEYDGKETHRLVSECVEEAIKSFQQVNGGRAPSHIIVLRDSVSPTEIRNICLEEIKAFKSAFSNLKLHDAKLTYAVLNKKNSLKAFSTDGGISNAPPGTIINSKVTSSEMTDFYIIPQKTNQGVSTAIHYQIIFDDEKVDVSDFYLLVYKLCYTYYNWTGSIKVPAPCQYAHKLAYLLGDKLGDRNKICLPDKRFSQELKSLYYL